MDNNSEILKTLIRIATGSSLPIDTNMFYGTNWEDVMRIASAQGVFAIAFDGIEKLPEDCRPDKKILIQWFGRVCYQEKLYERNWKVAQKLADLWLSEGIETLVLKGRAIAQYYPKPAHRYSCDLDVFIGNDWDKACQMLEARGVKLVREVYKEVEFTLDKVYVECHRYITQFRGNETLQRFEKCLRRILAETSKQRFDETSLLCPPLMFTVMLFIEHALGDLLHGKLSLKHLVDWMILRKQSFDVSIIELRCKEFGFDRFLSLIDTLADVLEGKRKLSTLPKVYSDVYKSLFVIPAVSNEPKSWFARRVSLFFEIIQNRRMYQHFGYCSMEKFLIRSVWYHFFSGNVETFEGRRWLQGFPGIRKRTFQQNTGEEYSHKNRRNRQR